MKLPSCSRLVLNITSALLLGAALSPIWAAELVGEPHVYKKVGGRELQLFMFKPKDWQASDQRPAIVFFHGGGWTGGAPNAFSGQSEYLASRGMVAVSVQYRLLPKDTPVAPFICMHDAKSALRWVRAHAAELGIDPARIAAGGGSAGGHLASFAGLVSGCDDPADDLKISAKPVALVLFNPFVGGQPDSASEARVAARFGTQGVEFLQSTPANHVTPDAPPTIIFHGSEDAVVPPAQIKSFVADMKKVGVRCEAVFYEGQGHSFFNARNAGGRYFYETLVAADQFLASLGWLQGPPTLAKPVAGEAASGLPSPKAKKKKKAAN